MGYSLLSWPYLRSVAKLSNRGPIKWFYYVTSCSSYFLSINLIRNRSRYKSQDFPYLVQMTLLCLKKDDKFVLWKHIRLVDLKNNALINCKLEETVAHRLHKKILSRKGNKVAGTVCFEVRIIFPINQFDQDSTRYKSQDFLFSQDDLLVIFFQTMKFCALQI